MIKKKKGDPKDAKIEVKKPEKKGMFGLPNPLDMLKEASADLAKAKEAAVAAKAKAQTAAASAKA